MKKNCAFTICSRNYLSLARVLKQSITKYSTSCDFYICIADDIDRSLLLNNEIICKDILNFKDDEWIQLAFKYDVTEFCTFLKPYCFDFFQNSYEKVCYFDPDILFYGSINNVFDELEDDIEFLLTPHIVDIENAEESHTRIEDELRGSGIYNFGFLGLKTSSDTKKFITWWKKSLYNKCYRDGINYLYTDQVWGNYITTYFDLKKIKIQRDLGWNVAPWNFCERKINHKNNEIKVLNRNNPTEEFSILFVHYSGYNYKDFCSLKISQNNQGHENEYEDVNILFEFYSVELNNNIDDLLNFLKLNYSYNFFSNGDTIDLFHRRLYRMLLLQKKEIGNPFDSNNTLFYQSCRKNKLISSSLKNKNQQYIVNNVNNKKLLFINYIMRIIFKIIGYDRYLILLKFLKGYGQFENQIHLIDRKNNVLWYRDFIINNEN